MPGLLLLLTIISSSPPPAAFELLDGDRVVLIGSTVIEREQRYSYWETALTIQWPDRSIIFRNLGWSGDTVWGEARAGFDTAKEGYKRLVEQTLVLKPTVIFIGYGTNESFAGQAGLGQFEKQLNRLLDDLKLSKARLVLLAPPQFEAATWPGSNFQEHQCDLAHYTKAIREMALQRHLRFVDEFCQRYSPMSPLTDDGMHLTPQGYWETAGHFLRELGVAEPQLGDRKLKGLRPKPIGMSIPYPPVFGKIYPLLSQGEKLRQAIVEKNRLYFHRWRPENETYLFGFRKYEQGQNASEISLFDPLVERLEKEIARLRKPVPHTYQLVPAEESKK